LFPLFFFSLQHLLFELSLKIYFFIVGFTDCVFDEIKNHLTAYFDGSYLKLLFVLLIFYLFLFLEFKKFLGFKSNSLPILYSLRPSFSPRFWPRIASPDRRPSVSVCPALNWYAEPAL